MGTHVDITERKRRNRNSAGCWTGTRRGRSRESRGRQLSWSMLNLEKLFGYQRTEVLGKKSKCGCRSRFRSKHPALRTAFVADPRVRPMGSGT